MQDVLFVFVTRVDLPRLLVSTGELEHVRVTVPLSDAAVELARVPAPPSKLHHSSMIVGPEGSGGVPQVQDLSSSSTTNAD